jgi:signal transduction histidine kinase
MPAIPDKKSLLVSARWNTAAYLCVASALVLVLAVTGWGAYMDLREVRTTLLQSEMNRIRSHAIRTTSRIQDCLAVSGSTLAGVVEEDNWLRKHWIEWLTPDESRAYAAIIDTSGKILSHSNRKLEGGRLGQNWYDRVLDEILADDPDGEPVVETRYPPLTGGRRVFDVRVPIIQHGAEIASYHSAVDCEWFQKQLAAKSAATRVRWAGILTGVLAVVAVTSVSLYNIVRRTILLREAMEQERIRQSAELGELAAGIAHEIRNPINAIRLNLHSLLRLQRFTSEKDGRELTATVAAANAEIERVEGLMRIMLGYARPDKPTDETIDLRPELEATLNFIKPVIERDGASVRCRLPATPLYVHLDRNRFRQIMLNLLTNAKDAVGRQGQIDVTLTRHARDQVEIVVADDGPGIPPANLDRVFVPFYSTKSRGTGLGLALVKRFVDEAHGTVTCDTSNGKGARFLVRFPEVAAITASTLVSR